MNPPIIHHKSKNTNRMMMMANDDDNHGGAIIVQWMEEPTARTITTMMKETSSTALVHCCRRRRNYSDSVVLWSRMIPIIGGYRRGPRCLPPLPLVALWSFLLVLLLLIQTTAVDGFRVMPTSSSSSSRRTTTSTSTSTSTQLAMFDQLTFAITEAIENTIGSSRTMTEKRIEPALKSVRRALLDADVNVNVADTLIAGVRERSLGTLAVKGITPNQQFIKAMNDELVDLMGGSSTSSSSAEDDAAVSRPAASLAVGTVGAPAIIVLAGLQGAGKTTAAAKLALYLKEREIDYDNQTTLPPATTTTTSTTTSRPLLQPPQKRNRQVLLVAADTYRPAAVDQLKILGDRIGVEVFFQPDTKPVDIVKAALLYARSTSTNSTKSSFDTVIIDTAGRQVIDVSLMNELKAIQKIAMPDETLLIVDAMTGQEAAVLTAAFDAAVGLTGAILTKLDGDARGGAAVSVRAVSGRPIKFVGTGEGVADLEPFYPDRMASRILGMGDVVSLVEKAAADVSEADAERMTQKILGTYCIVGW
jgi:signal recognition particle GTPase